VDFIPYLGFAGNCREAFTFYEDLFDGKITAMVTYGETPMAGEMPEATHGMIAHASVEIDGKVLMGGDCGPEQYQTPQGMTVNIVVATATEAEELFAALSLGGTVCMKMEETFWAERFGVVTDRYGTPWMINCFRPMEEQDCG
jgi:PhnB protein